MKKIFNLNLKNIKGNPVLTVIGTIAALSLPFVTEHLDAETVGGAFGLFILGALAGFKKTPVVENIDEVKEIAPDVKTYVDDMVKQTKKDLPKFKK